jgi:hypothetical protein
MKPDGPSLLLLAALGGLVLLEIPATGTVTALLRLLFLAVTAALVFLEGPGSRGFFSFCAGQAVAVTGAIPATAVAGEALLLLLFLRVSGAGAGEARDLALFGLFAAGVVLLFTVTRGLVQPLVILGILVLLTLIVFPLADYRLKRTYGEGGPDEALQ